MASCCSLLSLFFFAYFQIGGQTCHVISSYKSLLSQSTLSLWQPSTRTWSLQPLFAWHSYGTLSCNISVIHICPALLVPWTSTLHTTFTKLLINIAKIARNSLFVQLMQMSSIFDQSVLEPVYMQTLSVLVKKYDTMWLQTENTEKQTVQYSNHLLLLLASSSSASVSPYPWYPSHQPSSCPPSLQSWIFYVVFIYSTLQVCEHNSPLRLRRDTIYQPFHHHCKQEGTSEGDPESLTPTAHLTWLSQFLGYDILIIVIN